MEVGRQAMSFQNSSSEVGGGHNFGKLIVDKQGIEPASVDLYDGQLHHRHEMKSLTWLELSSSSLETPSRLMAVRVSSARTVRTRSAISKDVPEKTRTSKNSLNTLSATKSETVQGSPPDANGFRTQGDCFDHIGTSLDAAIQKNVQLCEDFWAVFPDF